MLQLKLSTADVIDQRDSTGRSAEKINALRQTRQLLIGRSIRHLQVIQTTVRQTGESGLGQVADIEVRMQSKLKGIG